MNWPAVLTQWSFDPAIVIGIGLAAVLYRCGMRNAIRPVGERKAVLRWRAPAFYAGLGVIVLALESPIDALSTRLFTFHMIQHLLLIMVAAPLMILGDPAITLLRGVPLSLRRVTLGFLARRAWVHHLGALFSWIMTPVSAFLIFLIDLYLWHWTWLFDLTLRNNAVHLTEHLCFLATSMLFWSQVIDQRAVHARLSYARRAAYLAIIMPGSNLLAMYFVFTPKPLYAYAGLPRLYGMTALGDQQIAGAVMWVPVMFLMGGALAVCLYKAIMESEHEAVPLTFGETPYSTVEAITRTKSTG